MEGRSGSDGQHDHPAISSSVKEQDEDSSSKRRKHNKALDEAAFDEAAFDEAAFDKAAFDGLPKITALPELGTVAHPVIFDIKDETIQIPPSGTIYIQNNCCGCVVSKSEDESGQTELHVDILFKKVSGTPLTTAEEFYDEFSGARVQYRNGGYFASKMVGSAGGKEKVVLTSDSTGTSTLSPNSCLRFLAEVGTKLVEYNEDIKDDTKVTLLSIVDPELYERIGFKKVSSKDDDDDDDETAGIDELPDLPETDYKKLKEMISQSGEQIPDFDTIKDLKDNESLIGARYKQRKSKKRTKKRKSKKRTKRSRKSKKRTKKRKYKKR